MAHFNPFSFPTSDMSLKHSKKPTTVERNRENHSVSFLPIAQKVFLQYTMGLLL
ncbi:hypothetical protein ERO13_A08G216600v2 [Gossypium hirsutum]|nr:hypothetical protein ERO13_A08G216600v2 [Gossypium hirsutum]